MYNLSQKLLAEFIGTFTLVFIGEGSVCADQYLHASGASGIGLLAIAAAHGLAHRQSLISRSRPHFRGPPQSRSDHRVLGHEKNQHTRCAFLLGGATGWSHRSRPICSRSSFRNQSWRAVGLGTPDLATDFTRFHGIVLESITTFLLVFVVFATAADPKGAFNKIAGFPIGLTVIMDILVSGPFTGGAMNPARAFGPALIAHHWTNHGVYWVGPLIGGVVAGWLYNSFLLKES